MTINIAFHTYLDHCYITHGPATLSRTTTPSLVVDFTTSSRPSSSTSSEPISPTTLRNGLLLPARRRQLQHSSHARPTPTRIQNLRPVRHSRDSLSEVQALWWMHDHPVLLTRLPKDPLASTQVDLPTHRCSGLKSRRSCVGLRRRAPREEPPQVRFRTHRTPRLGWIPGSPAQARPGQRPPERVARRSELP